MEHIADVNRAPRVVPNARVEEVFAYLCRVFEFLQHRLKLHFKYKLACEVIFARYQFKSRLHTPGREYLSFATILITLNVKEEWRMGDFKNIEI